MNTAMSSEGNAVKVEGGHISVTTISMSGSETSNGENKVLFFLSLYISLCCLQHILSSYIFIVGKRINVSSPSLGRLGGYVGLIRR